MGAILETIGWFGSILYIVSYFLISLNFIRKNKLYYVLNFMSAFLIVVVSLYKKTYQPVFINLVWMYISYMGYKKQKIHLKFINKSLMSFISILFILAFLVYIILKQYGLSFEVLAWFSVFAFCGSYFLYSLNKINDKTFHFYNLLAATSIMPKVFIYHNYQVLVLEVMWAILALYAFLKNKHNDDYVTLCS